MSFSISPEAIKWGAFGVLAAAFTYATYRFLQKRAITKPLKKAEQIYSIYYKATNEQKAEMHQHLDSAFAAVKKQGAERTLESARIQYLFGRYYFDQRSYERGVEKFYCALVSQLDQVAHDQVESYLRQTFEESIINSATRGTVAQTAQFAFSLLGIGDYYFSDLRRYRANQGYVDKIYFMARCIFQFIESQPKRVEDWTYANVKVKSVEKIWDGAPHSAFTDLIEYKGNLLVCFRESDAHDGGKDGAIRILRKENNKWNSIALLSCEGLDLRDPKLSIMPDGRLMLTLGGEIWRKENDQKKLASITSLVAFSNDGVNWSPLVDLKKDNEWIWRVTWNKGIGYGVAYHITPGDNTQPWTLSLVKTTDGVNYETITSLEVPDKPSEVTLRFLPGDTMVALARKSGTSLIGTASAPYKDWKWEKAGSNVGGPNFVVLPNGKMMASGRLYFVYRDQGKVKEYAAYTALGAMTPSSYKPELILPSGDDNSYPGLVYKEGRLFVSYYSSHEGQSNIYFAEVS